MLSTHAPTLLGLHLLALACSSGGPPPPSDSTPPERAIYSPAPVPSCRVVFSPDEAARHDVEAAALRWSLAMNCEVVVEPGGVPVTATPLLFVEYDEAGHATTYAENVTGDLRALCGLSTWNEARTAVERIEIALEDVACSGEYAAAHELWHALVGERGHAASGVGAAADNPAKSEFIDEPSLMAVCTRRPCGGFEPEL